MIGDESSALFQPENTVGQDQIGEELKERKLVSRNTFEDLADIPVTERSDSFRVDEGGGIYDFRQDDDPQVTHNTNKSTMPYTSVAYFQMAEDSNNRIYWVSFVYGLAMMAPWNAVLSTLDFFEAATPNYPISFVVTFAINGVMVVVVLFCIAY